MTTTITRSVLAVTAAAALTFGLAACHGKSDGGAGSASSSGSAGKSGMAGMSGMAGKSGTAGSADSGVAKASATVVIKGFAFNPSTVTIKAGGKVTWKFEDDTKHNVDIASLKKQSPDMQTGDYSVTFAKPGTYNYICGIHQYMTGKVVVK